jgi:hypothetical protein
MKTTARPSLSPPDGRQRRGRHGCDLPALAVACLVATVLGCSSGEPGASPEAAVAQLISAAHSGDRAAVYHRLGPRTRGHIEDILAAARKSGGARLLRAEDLVTVGWVPPAWEATSIHELHRQDDEAEVDVSSAAGDHQAITVVREGKRWMVELPLH